MRNIFIIIISLLLVSCSDDNNNKNEVNISESEIITDKEPKLENDNHSTSHPSNGEAITNLNEITKQKVENDDNSTDDKWDKIVELDDSEHSIPIEGNEDSVQHSIDTKTVSDEVSQKQELYKPTFNVSKNDIVLGNINSNVVVVEYFSPTCPHCAYYNKIILPSLKKKYIDTNKIAYVIREYIGNKQDLDAAILGRCQNNQDSFLNFQSVILEQQDKWSTSTKYRELLTNIAGIGGVSAESYAKCLNDEKILETLLANTKLVADFPHFLGTPSFFVNGKLITTGYSVETISKVIDEALKNSVSN